MDLDIVLGDDIDLLRLDLPFENDDTVLDRIDNRHNKIQSRIEGFHIFPKLLDNEGLRLRNNLDRFETENNKQ